MTDEVFDLWVERLRHRLNNLEITHHVSNFFHPTIESCRWCDNVWGPCRPECPASGGTDRPEWDNPCGQFLDLSRDTGIIWKHRCNLVYVAIQWARAHGRTLPDGLY